jgi:hypothetical protein
VLPDISCLAMRLTFAYSAGNGFTAIAVIAALLP